MRMIRRLPVLRIAALFIAICAIGGDARQQKTTGFAAQIEALSEPGGYFDTDNLISNERSYLQVLPDARAAGVAAASYIGVGPDQNFSYIARLRPPIAFIVDIRRDNLLLHLLFKAVFEQARTRIEYLALLVRPADARQRRALANRSGRAAGGYIDAAPPNASRSLLAGDGSRRAIAPLRRPARRRRHRDDREVPRHVHRRRARVAVRERRPTAAEPLPDVSAICWSRPMRSDGKGTSSRRRIAFSSSSRWRGETWSCRWWAISPARRRLRPSAPS